MAYRKTQGTCRDCRRIQPVSGNEWLQASKPRCIACGGMLDRTGIWKKSGCGKDMSSALSSINISYPDKPSEFEVQSFLFTELLKLGIDVRGEVSSTGAICQFDLVIFRNRCAIRIIEVKPNKRQMRQPQLKKYREYGLPIDAVHGMRQAKEYIGKITSGVIKIPGYVALESWESFSFIG